MSESSVSFPVVNTAQTIVVSTTSEFEAALQALDAGAGGTIKLDGNGGPYLLQISNVDASAAPILIEALDSSIPPVVNDIVVKNSSSITFNELYVTADDTSLGLNGGDAGNVEIYSSSQITFQNSVIKGDAEEMWTESTSPAVPGMKVVDSSDVSIKSNLFENLSHGVRLTNVQGLEFTQNELTQLQGDGIGGYGIQDAVISDNYMHDFLGSTQAVNHSDMIQIFARDTGLPTQNVEISGNVLDTEGGASYQGIFIRNEAFGQDYSTSDYYSDITIYDNVVRTGNYHGISVADTEGLEVYANTVIWDSESYNVSIEGSEPFTVSPSIKVSNAPDSVVYDNIATNVQLEDPQAVADNYEISYTDPSVENYFHNHFVNLEQGENTDFRDISILSSSQLYNSMGATASSDLAAENMAVFRSDQNSGDSMGFEFSAEYSLLDGTQITSENVEVFWVFDDGYVAQGLTAYHTFDTPGQHEVALVIQGDNGYEERIIRSVVAEQYDLTSLEISDEVTDLSGHETEFVSESENGFDIVEGRDGQNAVKIGEANAIKFAKGSEHLTGLETLQIDLGLKLDAINTDGSLLQFHNSYDLNLQDDGSLKFVLLTSEGVFSVTTPPSTVSASVWHDVSIKFDGPAESLELFVDGELAGTSTASGITVSNTSHQLFVGSAWGADIDFSVDTFNISAPPSSTSTVIADTSFIPTSQFPFDQSVFTETSEIIEEDAEEIQPSTQGEIFIEDASNKLEIEQLQMASLQQEYAAILDFGADIQDISNNDSQIRVVDDGASANAVGRYGQDAFQMDDESFIVFDRYDDHLKSFDSFQIEIGLKLDEAQQSGYLFRHHASYSLSMSKDGSLKFVLVTDEGVFQLTTDSGTLGDTDWHDIVTRYDKASNLLEIAVDGETVASTEASGSVVSQSAQSLTMGDRWGKTLEATVDTFAVLPYTSDDTLSGAQAFSNYDVATYVEDDAASDSDAYINSEWDFIA